MSDCKKDCEKQCESPKNQSIKRCYTTEINESLIQKEQESDNNEQNS